MAIDAILRSEVYTHRYRLRLYYTRTVGYSIRLWEVMHVECLLTCSRKKLWLEKANMQMSIYRSRPVSARFKYRAYINRYLQAAH